VPEVHSAVAVQKNDRTHETKDCEHMNYYSHRRKQASDSPAVASTHWGQAGKTTKRPLNMASESSYIHYNTDERHKTANDRKEGARVNTMKRNPKESQAAKQPGKKKKGKERKEKGKGGERKREKKCGILESTHLPASGFL